MTRPMKVGRRCGSIGQQVDRQGSFLGTNPSGNAMFFAGIDRHTKGGALGILIVDQHGWEFQLVHAFAFHSDANNTRRVPDNGGHVLRLAQFRSHDKVAFILAVHVVNDNHNFTSASGFDSFQHGLLSKAISIVVRHDTSFFLTIQTIAFAIKSNVHHLGRLIAAAAATTPKLSGHGRHHSILGWHGLFAILSLQQIGKIGVSHAMTLGFQVAPIVFIGLRHHHGNGLMDLDSQCFQEFHLAGVIGHEMNASLQNAHFLQNTGHDTIITAVFGESQVEVGVHGIHALVLQRIGRHLVGQTNSPSFLLEINHATTLLLDKLKRHLELLAAVATLTSKHFGSDALIVNAHGNGLVLVTSVAVHGTLVGRIQHRRFFVKARLQQAVRHAFNGLIIAVGNAVGPQMKIALRRGQFGFRDKFHGHHHLLTGTLFLLLVVVLGCRLVERVGAQQSMAFFSNFAGAGLFQKGRLGVPIRMSIRGMPIRRRSRRGFVIITIQKHRAGIIFVRVVVILKFVHQWTLGVLVIDLLTQKCPGSRRRTRCSARQERVGPNGGPSQEHGDGAEANPNKARVDHHELRCSFVICVWTSRQGSFVIFMMNGLPPFK
mmetsp:Transcript_10583/g.25333  ORF Transcript_10583/g.25333 Transcript_10583/m.25333 type:complete len:601 (+) Transcript_10583:406-2208(+)